MLVIGDSYMKKNIGKYEVSSDGSIKNLKSGKLVAVNEDKDGFLLVWMDGKTQRLARIILETFNPPIKNKATVHYKDHNPKNCSLNNLYWGYELNKVIDGEKWKKIYLNNQETWYSVSDMGRIRNDSTGTILKGKYNPTTGYMSVHLRYRIDKYVSIHRTVLKAFQPNNEADVLYVNHKNGIKTDNRLSNLEWATPSENIQHAVRTGLIKTSSDKIIYVYNLDGTFNQKMTVQEFQNKFGAFRPDLLKALETGASISKKMVREEYSNRIDPWYKTPTTKKCYLYTINGDFIKSFDSQKDLANFLKYSPSYISQAIKEHRIIANKYIITKQLQAF